MERTMVQLLVLLLVAAPLLAQDTPLSIRFFSVQQTSVSVTVTLTLSGATSGTSGCFMDKLTFVSDDTIMPSTTRYTPIHPGTCEFSGSASNVLTGTMTISDYTNAITFLLLTSTGNSYITVTGSSTVTLVPGVIVTTISTPLQAMDFMSIDTQPMLVSFDLDLSANQVLLHFDALTDSSTMMINELRLSSGPDSFQTLSDSTPSGSVMYSTTQCISLSTNDLASLQNNSICTNPSSCFCSFSSSLITDYRGNTVVAINSLEPLEVSIFRNPGEPTFPVFMRLSLMYIGCTAIHNLAEDEVFVLRPYESVSSINCSTNTQQNSSNIRPQISRQNSFSGSVNATFDDEYIFYDWPLTTYLNFSRGLPSELYGQYVCRSSVGYYVRNYVHNNNSNIELPGGTLYRLPLKDPLTISLYFGTYPQTNLSRGSIDISLIDTATGNGVGMEPVVDKQNPYHVDIKYSRVEEFLSGDYDITIVEGSTTIARQPITIDVTAPTLILLPEVATVLPGQQEVELMCSTNSDALQVMWFSSTSTTPLSSSNTYIVQLPPDSFAYTCSIRDPVTNNVVASGVVIVRSVQEILSVWQDGDPVENNSLVEVSTRDLDLQCIEHVESGFTNLTWFVLPDNGSLIIPSAGKESDTYRVIKSGNQANLTIDNSADPFRGLLKCSSSSGQVVSVRVVQDADVSLPVCVEEVDGVWGVQWSETLAGSMDFQPCPSDTASGVNGLILRLCDENGDWSDSFDITNCSSENVVNLQNMAQSNVFDLSNAYTPSELNILLTGLINELITITQPRETTHFPRDLDVINNMLETLVDVLSEEDMASSHTEIVTVLDNLLYASNIEGWVLLSEINDGSQRLLRILETFGVSLLESLEVTGTQSVNMTGTNIVVSAMMINNLLNQSIYPSNLDRGAQITIPTSLLQQVQATGAAYIILKNLDDILPKPDNMLVPESNQLLVASTVLSTQIMTSTGLVTSQRFSDDEVVSLKLVTDRVSRAFNPICVFWDANEGQWSREGVETVPPIIQLENGESKQFSVSCTSNHLTAFAVAVDVDISEFDFSIPVYIGCGFVIFSSVLSMFSLLLSWIFDGLRKYSVVAFLVHMSFIASLLCAYIAFLAGIEQALNNRIGCAAVAGLLHYFFTAAFSWLLCEGLLLIFFQTFSQYCGTFIIIFLLGWGLPAIPTAISIGILHETYGTTTQCWFFFDGVISNDVVLGFIVPKLIIIAITLLLLIVGCCTTCKFSNKKMQPYIQASVTRVLWLIWASICIFLFFLAAVWVFALLLVNVYGIDSEIIGWVFMVASIILSLWMFIFSAVTMVINQKVDYERVWNSPDPVYPSSDPGRGKGYQFMNMPTVDLTGRRTSTLTRPPQTLSNPVFGVENT